jgi:hypothetical protein
MRFELAGSLSHPTPLILNLTGDQYFYPAEYIDKGYTNFDVICIGGAGGMGGGIDTANTGTLIRSYGGAGGGGGLHRVQGLLSALPASCPVVVGAGGSLGTEHVSDPAQTTDGGNGGYSSFNATTCRASGGMGGKRVRSNSFTVTTQAHGGVGGIGGTTVVGGGGIGGVAGTPSSVGPGTPGTSGVDGTWDGVIGSGGGGGAGGVGKYGGTGTTCNAATAGGRGSYNTGDLYVYGPGGLPDTDGGSGSLIVVPGSASGAKTAPVSGLPNVYGQSKSARVVSGPGIVAIRLTSV